MIPLPPPPTYAQVLLTDPSSGIVIFNPIWLNWFVQLAALVSATTSTFTTPVTFSSTAAFSSYTDYARIAQPAAPGAGFTRVSSMTYNGNYGFLIQVPAASINYLVLNSVGTSNGYVGRRANGTATVPTAVSLNDILGSIGVQGYGTTDYVAASSAGLLFTATENYTDTAAGAIIQFYTVANGTTLPVENMRVWDNGAIGLGGPTGAESMRVSKVAGSTRWITAAGSVAGNPTLGVSAGKLTVSAELVLAQAQLMETSVALTNNAAAAVGTLNNAPVAGDPTKWIPINDNGVVRNIPAW